jgi:hypothetical protein
MREYNIECALIASIMFLKLRLEFQFRTIALDRADQSRLSSYSGVDPYATWRPQAIISTAFPGPIMWFNGSCRGTHVSRPSPHDHLFQRIVLELDLPGRPKTA